MRHHVLQPTYRNDDKNFRAQEMNRKFNFFPPLLSQMPSAASIPHQNKWRDSKVLNHLISSEQQLTPRT